MKHLACIVLPLFHGENIQNSIHLPSSVYHWTSLQFLVFVFSIGISYLAAASWPLGVTGFLGDCVCGGVLGRLLAATWPGVPLLCVGAWGKLRLRTSTSSAVRGRAPGSRLLTWFGSRRLTWSKKRIEKSLCYRKRSINTINIYSNSNTG